MTSLPQEERPKTKVKQDILAAALECLDRGWSIMPLHPESKYPRIRWQPYQERLPTEEEVVSWWTTWPDSDIGLITGAISGIVVVDCDDEEAAEFAALKGMRSPVEVTTKRGKHIYFRHPRDGVRRGPRAGGNSRGIDWPRVKGLDFRGDGGYAKLPPSGGYAWLIAPGHDFDDMPLWHDWSPTPNVLDLRTGKPFDFADIDLSHIPPHSTDEWPSEWDRTEAYVREHFPGSLKLPTGKGHARNERVMRAASEAILEGEWGAALRARVLAFQAKFFVEPLPTPEWEATCASMEQAERRNHPERFGVDGSYIGKPRPEPAAPAATPARPLTRYIFASDAEAIIEAAGSSDCLIEPWLRRGTIVQVHGYSGSGKSLFLQHALYAAAAGSRSWGPFHIQKTPRVLYLDWENGPRTLGTRLIELKSLYGDAGDRFGIWTPFYDTDITLRTVEGLSQLQAMIEEFRPDVVVIDTIRSAWSGLAENDADAWSPINRLAIAIRNAGPAVILLHHSNKPQGDSAIGREAGSSNQLTVLESQIRVTAVYKDKDTAYHKGGVSDESYAKPVWPMLSAKLPAGGVLTGVVEVRYGKLREISDEHDPVQWIGYGQDAAGSRLVVSSTSTKQKAKALALDGHTVPQIATALYRPSTVIERWLGIAP
jgi:hypothetical protein